MRIHDISIALYDGALTYPGNPEVRVTTQQAITRGASANVSTIQFGSHTGTHADAPRHFFENGHGVDELPLERLVGSALVVEFHDDVRAIDRSGLERARLGDARRVLFKTRNSALLRGSEFASDYTYLDPGGAEYLVERGVQLVGADYLSIEQFRSGHHRAHLALLAAGVVILEGLDLSQVSPGNYELVCLPLRLVGLDGAPARAILIGPD